MAIMKSLSYIKTSNIKITMRSRHPAVSLFFFFFYCQINVSFIRKIRNSEIFIKGNHPDIDS